MWSLLMATCSSSLGYHNPKIEFSRCQAPSYYKEPQSGVDGPTLLLTDTLSHLTWKVKMMTPVLPTSGPREMKCVRGGKKTAKSYTHRSYDITLQMSCHSVLIRELILY